MAKAAVLTEALPYILDFRGSVVLVKVGGSVMEGTLEMLAYGTAVKFV